MSGYGNGDSPATDGNNTRRRIRIKILPRGSRSGSSNASSNSPPTVARDIPVEKAQETSSVAAPVEDDNGNETESPLTVSPVSANNSSPSTEDKSSENPSPSGSSDSTKKSPTTAQGKSTKRRISDESRRSTRASPTMPPNFPPCPITNPDASGIALWHQGCEAVQRPDGTVDGLDVVNWMMTRRGGIANPWPRLEENRTSLRAMRRERIDLQKLAQRQEEEAEIARQKEERRLANKRRYRPRGQIAKEKAERAAAAAAAAAAAPEEEAQQQAQEETSGTNKRSLTEETEADNEESQAKKAKLDATI
ncbi:hypothetical protein ACHAPT_000021 [Fusarium lateritium]